MNGGKLSYLFAAAIFTSAFLLFQVQPLISKVILPWFGGTPNVWTTCLLFFQTALLGGYVYAHVLTDALSVRNQVIVHVSLLLLAAVLVQIIPDPSWKPGEATSPVPHILQILVVTVGLPYFALSTTGPLLQSWFGQVFPNRSPYRLYALSNAGSLLALLSYPFLFEPMIGMREQAGFWSKGFVGVVLLCGLTGLAVARYAPAISKERHGDTLELPNRQREGGRWWQWFGLAMLASVMLLATTNHICQNVAVVPFLWVAPLSIYLLTFILCFDGERWYQRRIYGLLSMCAVCLAVYYMVFGIKVTIAQQVPAFLLALFALCMLCHGELARLKPEPKRLTAFYLNMAAGGAAGGVLVAVVAPLVFPTYLEMHIGLLCCAVLARYVYQNARTQIARWMRLALWSCVLSLAGMLVWDVHLVTSDAVYIDRNFYGVLRILESEESEPQHEIRRVLTHGQIIHGMQYQSSSKAMQPNTYYGPDSGVSRALDVMHRQRGSLNVGLVGLGVGTIAAHGVAGDRFRFYEINEKIVELAQEHFSFLSGSDADTEVILGDARLVMERELDQNYDLLVLDAFSGDGVPTHLLTTEAMKVYQRHLAPNGVLAIHITNGHLDLRPVAAALADAAKMEFRVIKSKWNVTNDELESHWLIASTDASLLAEPAIREKAEPTVDKRVVWTDDFSNLFSVLKF